MFRKILAYSSVIIGLFMFSALNFAHLTKAQQAISSYEQQRRQLNANTVTIMGSQAKTSYTRFAQDMQNVLDDPKTYTLRVLPILGRGGGQNFLDMLFLKGIDMGLVERDVIDEFKKKDPQTFGNVENRLRYIMKLSNSEMHFFARHEIKKLEDLRGKKISFYKPLSSSEQAIKKILGACGIEVQGIHMDTQLGAKSLRSGEIVAVGRISGAPHGALVDFTKEDGHFLPLDKENLPPGCFDKLMKMYLPAFLKHEHYPNVLAEGQIVPTVANATLLVTYNFNDKTERYRRIEAFVNKLFDNIDKFSTGPRHPKWKEVSITATVPGWTRFKAAQEWVDANVRKPAAGRDQMTKQFKAFKDFVRSVGGRSNLNSEDLLKMFLEFQEFQKQNPPKKVVGAQ